MPVSLMELAIRKPATPSTSVPPMRNLVRGFIGLSIYCADGDSAPGVAHQNARGRNTRRVPREVLRAHESAAFGVGNLLPDAEGARDHRGSAERRLVTQMHGPQAAVRRALDERRHQEMLGLVRPEPAVAARMLLDSAKPE